MSFLEDRAYHLLTEYSSGFMVSQVVFAACELGVFDLLAEAPEPLDVVAIAEGLGTSSCGTERLLQACVALQLLSVETRAGQAAYRNTALSRTYLCSSGPRSQRNMLLYLGSAAYRCWAHLAAGVREGKNQYPQAQGTPAGDVFAAIYRSQDEQLLFMRGLQETWSIHGRSVLTAFDLSAFAVVCDLGGGSGALAQQCASLYPRCKVTVFDIPEVVQMAKTHFPWVKEGPVGFREGDFFEDPLPEADLYILARVLHDWTEEKCSRLLASVYQACRPGGGILVVESMVAEDGRGPLSALLFSLNMLLQTEGRERSATQYRRLLSSAGFGDFQLGTTGGLYQAMLARKSLPRA